MSRTRKDAPYLVKRARMNGKKLPKNWRNYHWRSRYSEYNQMVKKLQKDGYGRSEAFDIMDKLEEEIFGPEPIGEQWSKMFSESQLKSYVRMMNRERRAKDKQKLRNGEYDDINNHGTARNSAKWMM